ncbi:MAG: pyridoxal phosphate-dependent aminotransferase [Pyramidobacter sp.]|jgi:aspartate aminotransferase
MNPLYEKTRRISQCSFKGGIRDIADACAALEKQGRETFHMEIGEPDFDSPLAAKEACKRAIDENRTHYSPTRGIEELRQAICAHERHKGFDLDPDNLVVTCGAEEALMTMMLALLDVGDEIILFTPCFSVYRDQAHLAGAVPVEVPAVLGADYGLDMEKLEAAVTDKTRVILLNTPNNPSGCMVSRADMDNLVKFVKERNLWLVADECYSEITYGKEHVSPLDYPEIAGQSVIISSASKTFAMTGWRVGFVYAPRPVIPALAKAHHMTTTCICTFAQVGAAAAFGEGCAFTRERVEKFKDRRDVVVQALKRCPGADFPSPEGAFYVLPSIEKLKMDPLDFVTGLMETYGVAVVPGDGFGIENRVRIAYTVGIDKVRAGMERFVKYYNECLEAAQKKSTRR